MLNGEFEKWTKIPIWAWSLLYLLNVGLFIFVIVVFSILNSNVMLFFRGGVENGHEKDQCAQTESY